MKISSLRDRIRGITEPRNRDRGGAAVLIGILIGGGVLLPMGALVVDVGGLYIEQGELQRGADAAAVAVAKACVAGNCTTSNLNAQRNRAERYADDNAGDGHANVTTLCGNWGNLPACPAPSTNLAACVGPAPTGSYVEVRVRTENSDGSNLVPPQMARTFAGNASYDGKTVVACARATAKDVCVSAANETYTHTFNAAAGTATIRPNQPLCGGQEQPVTLVTYTAPETTWSTPQFVYDSDTKVITSTTTSLTFNVDVPPCNTQVDFVFGDTAYNPLTETRYFDTKLAAGGAPGNRSSGPAGWANFGPGGHDVTCVTKPNVTYSYSTTTKKLTITLTNGTSNGGTAVNVDAAFQVTNYNGTGQLVRVPKGTSKTVTLDLTSAGRGSNVVVMDSNTATVTNNNFKTYTWTKP